MAVPQRAGKTAPRLVQDILLYDPAHPSSTGRNLLSEVPPVYPERYNGALGFLSPSACRHNYVTKPNQTFHTPEDQKRRPGCMSKVHAMCTKCRCHVQIVVNYTNGMNTFSQNLEGHIHHLVYKSGRQAGGSTSAEVTPKGQLAETFHYQCSNLSCPAIVSLRILSPLLSPELVHLLTDQNVIRKRAQEAMAAQPERLEGMACPSSATVLDNLRLYVSNTLKSGQPSKAITATNKRFMLSFGVDGMPCQKLFEFLNFTYQQENNTWQPPQPDPSAKTESPYQDTDCIFLDNIVHELLALIDSRPSSEKKGFDPLPRSASATNDMLYAVEALDYPKSLRVNEFDMPPAPFYEDLGAVEDMASSMIVEAFNRQVSVDPARTPLYLRCLKSIATLRGGADWEIIDQAVQFAYSEGKYTDEDVADAYKYFGLNGDDPNLTEDIIIKTFYVFIGSTAQAQETEARQQLWRIGHSRRSERIQSASEDRVSNAEQAQIYLGVDDQTPDDFIITMYTAKVNDNPTSRELANRAVNLIAESRNSVALKHFVDTGETVAGEMDVSDAYRLLQIPDRTADEGAIVAAYTICVDDNPENAEKYNYALSIIAKDMDSPLLKNMAGISTESSRNLAEWPVGLQNIGNTCYLNSLLQFYFSIRPFRDMVLDFETFQMDLNDQASLDHKQVGSRKVMKKEVERSLRFLRELRTLFNDMITSPQSSVTPGQELARLTLISPSNEAAIRRRSTISAGMSQGLGDIGGAPIFGPLGPPQPIQAQSAPAKDSMISDVDSEATLVSENTAALPEGHEKAEPKSEGNSKPDTDDAKPESPHQPPLPPRSSPEVDRQKQLIEEVEIGAQQDVTEVINNVLFQSQCAIKPRDVAKDGEQLDQIKDLFYGRTRSYISTEGGTRSKEEWWADIKVDVASGSRDIYAAIDGAFDVQKINVENAEAEQFGSISRLPPVLQIQVQRVQFDAVKKSSFKSTNHLELLETIYLDRYMDTQKPEIVNRRRQCWEWKRAVKSLEARRAELLRKDLSSTAENGGETSMEQLFWNTQTALQELDQDIDSDGPSEEVKSTLPNELEQVSGTAKEELCAVEQEIKDTQAMISSQFADYRNLAYQLYAVFVHHGSVTFGHYYIYIYDFQKDIWRKYNDEYVTEVQNLDEIFKNDKDHNPPTPYFLVYVNKNMKDRLVDPVCREVVESMPEMMDSTPPTTTAMQGVHVSKPSDDLMDLDPPSYDEASSGPSAPGMEADAHAQPKSQWQRHMADNGQYW
ncbi:hypothetical protein N7510_009185 [Penicillium lagena]|uniref:uncharacterized protein n=1 Tax=Penicillium lagena TaxID=94218 RepID=UPI0025421FE2|nr:uncharacterized protein N7510_009185 [Penicillium lagena]KAJ5606404.1 hypothetical protein N7510_009185 [Penicillium lagena]